MKQLLIFFIQYEKAVLLGCVLLSIALTILTAFWLQRRASKKGPLFSQPPTLVSRIGAIVLGIFFGVVTLLFYYFGRAPVILPIVSIGLLAYGVFGHRFIGTV